MSDLQIAMRDALHKNGFDNADIIDIMSVLEAAIDARVMSEWISVNTPPKKSGAYLTVFWQHYTNAKPSPCVRIRHYSAPERGIFGRGGWNDFDGSDGALYAAEMWCEIPKLPTPEAAPNAAAKDGAT